ncbi:MAG TPA: DUF2076 domain-containing protein [Stellaceae bacterium]|nr:DUF2076 domain-containing protein [Stellaceae bacterium]
MTPQEQQLLTALIDRLRSAPPTQMDPEANQLISALTAARPDTAYLLAQTVLMQDFALNTAKAQLADLQRQLAEAKAASQPAGGGSFLGGLLGRGSVPNTATPNPAPGPAPSPWHQPAASGGYAQPAPPPPAYQAPAYQPYAGQPVPGAPVMQPSQTSGFLRQAATTAAGVAGGALLFEGISSLFSGHQGGFGGGGFGGGGFGGAGFGQGMGQQPSLTEVTEVTNNYYGTQPGQPAQEPANYDRGTQDASVDPYVDPAPGGDQGYAQDADYTPDDSFDPNSGGDDYA